MHLPKEYLSSRGTEKELNTYRGIFWGMCAQFNDARVGSEIGNIT